MNILRVEYAITGAAAFLSHLEVMKTFERAIRRAKIPIAFSEGFNPHPKIAVAVPLSVGMAGKHEYLDIELQEAITPRQFLEGMNQILPEGFEILKARLVPKGKPLMAVINAASYRVELDADKIPLPDLRKAIDAFLAKTECIIERKTQKGIKTIDVRKGVLELKTALSVLSYDLELLLAMGNEGNVRPEEVAKAILMGIDMDASDAVVKTERTGLFVYKNGKRILPINFGSEEIV